MLRRHFLSFLLPVCLLCLAIAGYAQTDITNSVGTTTAQYTDSPSGEEIGKLIDNSTSTKYLTFHASGWVQFQASAGAVVVKYTITSANDAAERDPKNFNLQGSNNGTSWTTLNTQTNQSFSARFQKKEYSFTNTTSYTYYRLNVTAVQSGTILQMAEWELWTGSGGTTVATLYQHCPLATGYAVPLAVGNYTLSQLQAKGMVNNDVSSVQVSSGYKVTLYDGDNYTGTSVVLTSNVDCLTANNFNDMATSVKVETSTTTPDFTLSRSPSSLTLNQGASGTSTITVNKLNGFNSSVSLSASGMGTGVTASFNPSSTTGTSTLTLTASSSAATGTRTVTVTGVSGSLTRTTTISLTVNGGSVSNTFYTTNVDDGLNANDRVIFENRFQSLGYTFLGRNTNVSSSALKTLMERSDIKILYHTGHGNSGLIATAGGSLTVDQLNNGINNHTFISATCITMSPTTWKSKMNSGCYNLFGYTEVSYDGPDDDVVNKFADDIGAGRSYAHAWYVSNDAVGGLNDRWIGYVREGSSIVEYSARSGNRPSKVSATVLNDKVNAATELLSDTRTFATEFKPALSKNISIAGAREVLVTDNIKGQNFLTKAPITEEKAVTIATAWLGNKLPADAQLGKVIAVTMDGEIVAYTVTYDRLMDGLVIKSNRVGDKISVLVNNNSVVSSTWIWPDMTTTSTTTKGDLLSVSKVVKQSADKIAALIKANIQVTITDVKPCYGTTKTGVVPAYELVTTAGSVIVNAITSDILSNRTNGSTEQSGSIGLNSITPNPFNVQATISYKLAARGNVAVNVYNALGQKVKSLVSSTRDAGQHRVTWNGTDDTGAMVVAGVYFVRLETGNLVQNKKLVVTR